MGENFRKTIALVHHRFKEHKIKWTLAGSANMRLQGMQVQPRCLDVVVQHHDLQKVSEILSDYSASAVKELKTPSDKPYWEVKSVIMAWKSFFGGYEDDIHASKLLASMTTTVILDGLKIPCLTFEA